MLKFISKRSVANLRSTTALWNFTMLLAETTPRTDTLSISHSSLTAFILILFALMVTIFNKDHNASQILDHVHELSMIEYTGAIITGQDLLHNYVLGGIKN